jgi:hypothetical protein
MAGERREKRKEKKERRESSNCREGGGGIYSLCGTVLGQDDSGGAVRILNQEKRDHV